jgi:cytochrome c556
MQRIHLFAGVTTVLAAAVLFAQSDSDYQGWMKTVAATNGSLQKNIAAKDAAAVAADAQKLQDTFKQVEMFWQKRNAADAVEFAKQAQNVAATVAADASTANMDKAAADAKTIGAACAGCHMAHREKTDTGFKIK